MLETPHVVLGATIAAKVANPVLALPLSFASHFLLDMTPHWNPHLNTELKKYGEVTQKSKMIVAIDAAIAVTAAAWIAAQAPSMKESYIILLGGFLGILPDVVEGPYFFLRLKSRAIEKWVKFQKSIQNDVPQLPGLLTQAVLVAACFWWILT